VCAHAQGEKTTMKSEEQIREEIKRIVNLMGYFKKKNDNHHAFGRQQQIMKLLWVLDDDEIEKK